VKAEIARHTGVLSEAALAEFHFALSEYEKKSGRSQQRN
jgi:hypothetical protein